MLEPSRVANAVGNDLSCQLVMASTDFPAQPGRASAEKSWLGVLATEVSSSCLGGQTCSVLHRCLFAINVFNAAKLQNRFCSHRCSSHKTEARD